MAERRYTDAAVIAVCLAPGATAGIIPHSVILSKQCL